MKTAAALPFALAFALAGLLPASDPDPPRIASTDAEALGKLVGQRARVFGKITRTYDWDGNGAADRGINFLDFEGGKFTVVTFERDYPNFEKRPAVLYQDKSVEIVGTVRVHKAKFQIELSRPEQVTVLPDDPGEGAGASSGEPGRESLDPEPEEPENGADPGPREVDPADYFGDS
jgi:hypothetical protein